MELQKDMEQFHNSQYMMPMLDTNNNQHLVMEEHQLHKATEVNQHMIKTNNMLPHNQDMIRINSTTKTKVITKTMVKTKAIDNIEYFIFY